MLLFKLFIGYTWFQNCCWHLNFIIVPILTVITIIIIAQPSCWVGPIEIQANPQVDIYKNSQMQRAKNNKKIKLGELQ